MLTQHDDEPQAQEEGRGEAGKTGSAGQAKLITACASLKQLVPCPRSRPTHCWRNNYLPRQPSYSQQPHSSQNRNALFRKLEGKTTFIAIHVLQVTAAVHIWRNSWEGKNQTLFIMLPPQHWAIKGGKMALIGIGYSFTSYVTIPKQPWSLQQSALL